MIKTISENASAELVIKKSKFIANIIPIHNEDEAKKYIEKISKKYYDAKHNCYAYRLEENMILERFSDNGEPNGTAGSPILELLKKQDINNILVVVTRYFGGVLLGTGGLIRAYTDVTKKALEKVKIVFGEKVVRYNVEVKYDKLKDVIYSCKKLEINVTNIDYKVNIMLTLESNEKKMEQLLKSSRNIEKSMVTERNVYAYVENCRKK